MNLGAAGVADGWLSLRNSENVDGLRHSVVEDLEIGRPETAHGLADPEP
jgi:hypothetical protein